VSLHEGLVTRREKSIKLGLRIVAELLVLYSRCFK